MLILVIFSLTILDLKSITIPVVEIVFIGSVLLGMGIDHR